MFAGYHGEVLIGEGGLGRVYRAVRTSTGGLVAIKELHEVPAASPVWHRAKRELEAMLRLKGHPYVVSVEEIIDGPAGPCLVMEYLPAGTLMDRLDATGPLIPSELILVGLHVTQALQAAHEVGIVHRDVKPHNLLVGSFGQVKVADFGIAALTREAGLHTRTQAITLNYASPEELEGDRQIGPPADVYSLAATLSHLATGRKPVLRGREITADLDELAEREPSLAALVAQLHRCLESEPADRPTMPALHQMFTTEMARLGANGITRLTDKSVSSRTDEGTRPSASTVAPHLPATPATSGPLVGSPQQGAAATVARVTPPASPIAHHPPTESKAPPPPSKRWLIYAGAVAVATTIAAAAVVLAHVRTQDEAAETNQTTAEPTSSPSTATSNLSPLVVLNGHTFGSTSASWSPDGQHILSTNDELTAIIWDSNGTEVARLTVPDDGATPASGISSAAWSPDGELIATPCFGDTLVWNSDGNLIATLKLTDRVDYWATWSPSGQYIVTIGVDATAAVWSAFGDFKTTLTGHFDQVTSADWNPAGTNIVTASNDGTSIVWDLDGNAVRVLAGPTGWVTSVKWSPDGQHIATTSHTIAGAGTVIIWDTLGNRSATLTGRTLTSADWSPDGQQLVTTSTDGTAVIWDVHGNRIAVLSHAGGVTSADWSPDGQHIVTTTTGNIAVIWDTHGRKTAILAGHTGEVGSAEWSPDGQFILTASADGTAIIWPGTN